RGDLVSGCIVDGGPDLCVESKLRNTAAFGSLGLAGLLIPVNPRRLPTFRRHGHLLTEMPTVMTDGLVTFRGGMRELVDTLTSALGEVDIRTSLRVSAIERSGDGYRVSAGDTSFMTQAVVVAIPSREFAEAVRVYPQLAHAVASVRSDPITTVSAAWARKDVSHALRGTGYVASSPVVPGEVSACTWTSSKIPSRSPRDVILIRGYCRSGDRQASTRSVLDEMSRVLGITAKPVFTRAYAWDAGLPVYPADYDVRLAAYAREARLPPSFAIAGSAFHGVGIGDCIISGERAADSIVASMPQRASVQA
ncbi:MAG: FAD-dependent oxidoreductase, partial [Gemmatimonadota bacterium]|nr:FAD-dependent oxidoreductase [Gemmatimonadota bacterium]